MWLFFCFMYYLLLDNNIRTYYTMNINETELRDAINEAWNPFGPRFN